MQRPRFFLIATVAVAMALGACTGGDDAASGATTTLAGAALAAPGTTAAATTTTAAPSTTVPPAPVDEDAPLAFRLASSSDGTPQVVAALQPLDIGRSIIFTATVNLEVEDVIVAGEQAQALVQGLGGLLFGQETTTGERARSVITIKVLPENFAEALRRLAGLGTLLGQTVFADDVTETIVDLESRITTAEASVLRLRGFLEDARDIAAIATLENELQRRETDLELLRGQLRTLENRVSLATIVLVLTQPEPPEPPEPPVPEPGVALIETVYAGHSQGEACTGSDELIGDEGDPITVCFEVTNTGNALLIDVEVRDFGLDVKPGDLRLVTGDVEVPLKPEERLIWAVEVEADPDVFPAPAVTATATDAQGERIREQLGVEIEAVTLEIVADTSLPGFGDAFSSGWNALTRIFGIITIGVGAALPFLWVPVLAFIAYRYTTRKSTKSTEPDPPRAPDPAPEPEPNPEPEPASID